MDKPDMVKISGFLTIWINICISKVTISLQNYSILKSFIHITIWIAAYANFFKDIKIWITQYG